MSRCPEHDKREAMSDAEFWAHVFGTEDPEEWLFVLDQEDEEKIKNPCQLCGSSGACSYDANGNPLIHIVVDEDDD